MSCNSSARGNAGSEDERLRRLGRFRAVTNHTPRNLIKLQKDDPQKFDTSSWTRPDECFNEGYKPSYVKNIPMTVKAWSSHFSLMMERLVTLSKSDHAQ
jgi:hypothetical protein